MVIFTHTVGLHRQVWVRKVRIAVGTNWKGGTVPYDSGSHSPHETRFIAQVHFLLEIAKFRVTIRHSNYATFDIQMTLIGLIE